MKTSGLFRIHSFEYKTPNRSPITIVIFGDVHRDSPNHADGAWQHFLQRARSLKNALYLGMGDYLDSASTSERSCLERSREYFHETTFRDLEQIAAAKVKLMSKELAFTKNKLIGLCNGNHFFSFSDGTNSDQKLCSELGCFYLGVSCFIRLYITSGQNRCHSIDIWAHHGLGASRLLGGDINRVEQMREHAEADVYIQGHSHKRMAVPATPRLSLSHNPKTGLQLKSRQQWLVRSGSFLASYRDNEPNYNVDAGRGPSSLGHIELILRPNLDKNSNVSGYSIDALTCSY